jgi:hypothetical protein
MACQTVPGQDRPGSLGVRRFFSGICCDSLRSTGRVVAPDGKTMTVTVKGTNGQGRRVNNVVVFDKQ